MEYINRTIESLFKKILAQGKSILLLGARQTGKTTLLKTICSADLFYTLLDTEFRIKLEQSPSLLSKEINAYKRLNPSIKKPLVIIDEVQKVPEVMDSIQLLIDNQEAQFVLTGSSVRKLRRHPNFNLLPGRVINLYLDPLNLQELSTQKFLTAIESFLIYGSLPPVYIEPDLSIKEALLQSYVKNYLEEEIRGEALVRQIGTFAKFLEFASVEAGHQININKISQEVGVSRHTIAEYFNVLEDCMVVEKISPLQHATSRRKLTKSPKYLFFDMGIKRICAGEGINLSSKTKGELFEQFIGLELLRFLRHFALNKKLTYWRDHAGPEVDYVIEHEKQYIPIEVKWTEHPTLSDAKHIIKFMNEYDCIKPGYIICRCARPILTTEDIIALPWQNLESLFAILRLDAQ